MLVWIASVPRSGNTLFRVLLHTYSGLPTYSLFGDALFLENRAICEAMGHCQIPVSQGEVHRLQDMPGVYFVKVHARSPWLWDGCGDVPAFFIVRDPRAVAVSLAHYSAWRTGKGSVEDLARDGWLKKGWSVHVQSWLDAKVRCAIVRYENMIARPFRTVRQAVETLGLDVELIKKERPAFESLHAMMPRFFRRGQVDGWKKELSPPLAALLWEQSKEVAMKLGYTEGGT